VAGETVVDVVVVNATFTSTREVVASHGTIKTRGTAHMAEVEIMEDGDTTNLRTIPTIPQPELRAIRMEGTRRHKTIIRTTNRAGPEDRLSRRTNLGLRINSHPMEVAEEGTIQDMMARTAAERMGTLEGEAVLLPIEEVRRTVVQGMTIKEVREGDMDMVVTVVADTTNPRRTAVAAVVVTAEAAVIIRVEVINPADHTAPVSSLTAGIEEVTTREAEAVGEGTDHTDVRTRILRGVALRFASSMLSSCFELTLVPFGSIPTVILSIYYVPKHHM